MLAKPYLNELKQTLGVNEYQTDESKLPDSPEELDLHMQLSYKEAVEIAEEEVIENTLKKNRFDNVKKEI